MLNARKAARHYLKTCSRADYDAAVYSAKLTPIQAKILNLYILDNLSIYEIAFRLDFCESLIRRRLSEVYDKVANL